MHSVSNLARSEKASPTSTIENHAPGEQRAQRRSGPTNITYKGLRGNVMMYCESCMRDEHVNCMLVSVFSDYKRMHDR